VPDILAIYQCVCGSFHKIRKKLKSVYNNNGNVKNFAPRFGYILPRAVEWHIDLEDVPKVCYRFPCYIIFDVVWLQMVASVNKINNLDTVRGEVPVDTLFRSRESRN
jgi:hypothetical protein